MKRAVVYPPTLCISNRSDCLKASMTLTERFASCMAFRTNLGGLGITSICRGMTWDESMHTHTCSSRTVTMKITIPEVVGS